MSHSRIKRKSHNIIVHETNFAFWLLCCIFLLFLFRKVKLNLRRQKSWNLFVFIAGLRDVFVLKSDKINYDQLICGSKIFCAVILGLLGIRGNPHDVERSICLGALGHFFVFLPYSNFRIIFLNEMSRTVRCAWSNIHFNKNTCSWQTFVCCSTKNYDAK